jgi:acyl-CoA synthetase (AMP-forming)/AMP-acid ligase II
MAPGTGHGAGNGCSDTPQNGHAEPHGSLIAIFEANVQRQRHSRLYTWLSTASCEETAAWTYGDVAERSRAVCCSLRRRWGATDGVRVMLVYPPGLDFVVGFLACQYAAVIAVPYYPPIIPPSPTASDGALKMLADGLAKLVRVYDSCNPEMLLSTAMCAAARIAGVKQLVTRDLASVRQRADQVFEPRQRLPSALPYSAPSSSRGD